MTTIRRFYEAYEEIEVPEGHKVCPNCRGAGFLSMYDQGWHSLMHSPRLAAKEQCIICGGLGYVEDYNA